MKTIYPTATGPARWSQLAHGHIWPARPKRKEGGDGPAGRRPTAWLGLAWLRQRPRRRCDVAAARLDHEAGGHCRPGQGELAGARGLREDGEGGRVARRGGEEKEGRLPQRPSTAAPWPTVAGLETALPELGSRRKREHDLKESEAELRARACWPRWRSHGGIRRRVRGRGERQSLGLSALAERKGSAGGSERAHRLQQV